MNKYLLIFWGANNYSSENLGSEKTDCQVFDDIKTSYSCIVFIENFRDVLNIIRENILTSRITLIIGAKALSSFLANGRREDVIELIVSFPEINIFFSKWDNNLFIPKNEIIDNPQRYIEPIENYICGDKTALDSFKDCEEIKIIFNSREPGQQRERDQLSSLWSRCLKSLALPGISTDLIVLDDAKLYAQLFSFDNLCDISNLRYAAKIWKIAHLKLYNNYKMYMDNRALHVGYSIDADVSHSRFCAYSLFSRGYRSMAISSWAAFDYIWNVSTIPDANILLIRDFDLQFGDDKGNNIDKLRGYTYSENRWKKCENPLKLLTSAQSYCVSNSYNEEFPYELHNVGKIGSIEWPEANNSIELKIPGTSKPICGINSLFINKLPGKYILKIREEGGKGYLIKRSRVGRDHAAPLDLYEIAQPLISRAEQYYHQQKYIHAAILSQEAIEILDGFHISLTLRAYHIHAIAENAMAMNILGGNEKELALDCKERIRQIDIDIARLLYKTNQDSNNVLNQIFSDCRLICKEKEHFESEDVFLAAMAELNEGGLRPLFRKIKNFFTS